MALQSDLNFKGITVPSAYSQITSVAYDKEAENTTIKVAIYKDATSAQAGDDPVTYKWFYANEDNFSKFYDVTVLDQSNVNAISQGYAYLKTLTDYAQSTDV